MDKLTAVLKALQVNNVIWIDDLFQTVAAPRGENAATLAQRIVEVERTAEFGLAADTEGPLEVLSERLQADTELYERAAKVVRGLPDLVASVEAKVHPCPLTKVSGTDWRTQLSGKPAAYSRTLFLLDRDFEQEGLSDEESDALLKATIAQYIVGDPSNFCVVLSRAVGKDTEPRDRAKLEEGPLAGQADKSALLRFSAISKQALQADPPNELADRLTKRLAGVVLVDMLKEMVRTMGESAEALQKLLVTEFEDVNRAVLVSSYHEGASEIEVLLRILGQSHRLEMFKLVGSPAGEPLRGSLGRFREFQLEHEVDAAHKIPASAQLRNLSRAEVISPGSMVNRMHLPVVPGDVFTMLPMETVKESVPLADPYQDVRTGTNYWMLLGPFCDLMLRGKTGDVKAKSALLVQLTVMGSLKDQDKLQSKNPADFRTGRRKCVQIADLALAFDYDVIQTANVAALQLAAFDTDGVAQLKMDGAPDDIVLYASVARAKMNAEKAFAAGVPEQYASYAVAFDGQDATRKLIVGGTPEKPIYGYPLKRLFRVRELEAAEALMALEKYWTRVAKPHDFTH